MSNLDFYHNFLMEIRPRIQSVNVLVNLKKKALKTPNICLSEDGSLSIIIDNVTYKIPCKKFNFVCDSLKSVEITEEFLSFRFSTTNPTNFGSFKSEILQSEKSLDYNKSEFAFTNDSKLKIQCRNCSQIFCHKNFKRVLPLPSEHSEPTDWFCHANDSDSNRNLTSPGEDDLFYLICYCHLNSKNLTGFLKCSSKNIVCRRCFACIGILINENCYRIWFNTVQISDDLITSWGTTGLNDVCLTIRNILKDSLLNSTRIIFKCPTNTTKDHQMDYLLLWVIESKLNILLNSDDTDGYNDVFVAKVLFKFSSGTNDTIIRWSNDVMVSNIDVSKVMMVEVLKHLYKMNKLLPTKWNSTNDFYISYLPLYHTDE